MDLTALSDEALFTAAAERWRELCAAQKRLLDVFREVDRRGAWELDGAHDAAHWAAYTFGLSYWRAERWVRVAEALARLPRTAEALETGELPIYKVEELVRFAEPEDEEALVMWARDTASGGIRAEAERRRRADAWEAETAEEQRYLKWRASEDGRSLEMSGRLPAADGALVADALDRIAAGLPDQTGEEHPSLARATTEQLRADALVALATGGAASGSSGGASVDIHAPLDALLLNQAVASSGWTDGGLVIPPQAVQRLLCNASVRTIVEDARGVSLGAGRRKRFPTRAMMRQLRYRDRRCVFPNCHHSRYTQAHHIRWWSQGGSTDLDNLVLLCSLHHKLVHEYGWSLERTAEDGVVRWFRPDGTGYRAGPEAA